MNLLSPFPNCPAPHKHRSQPSGKEIWPMTSKEDLERCISCTIPRFFSRWLISSHSPQYTLSLSSTHFAFYIILAFLRLLSKFTLDFQIHSSHFPRQQFHYFCPYEEQRLKIYNKHWELNELTWAGLSPLSISGWKYSDVNSRICLSGFSLHYRDCTSQVPLWADFPRVTECTQLPYYDP